MKRISARAAVVDAERRLLVTRQQHQQQTRWLRAALQRHRVILVAGTGLAGGMLVGWLPLHRWLRSGVSLLSAGIALARTPLGSIAFAAMFGKQDESTTGEHAPPG